MALPANAPSPRVATLLFLLTWALYLTSPIYDGAAFRAIADGNFLRSAHGFLTTDLGVYHPEPINHARWLFDLICSFVSDFGVGALVVLELLAVAATLTASFVLVFVPTKNLALSLLLAGASSAAIFLRGEFSAEQFVLPLLLWGLVFLHRRVGSGVIALAIAALCFIAAANVSPFGLTFLLLLALQSIVLRHPLRSVLLALLPLAAILRPWGATAPQWLFIETLQQPLERAMSNVVTLQRFDVALLILLGTMGVVLTAQRLGRVVELLPLVVIGLFLPDYRSWTILLVVYSIAIATSQSELKFEMAEALRRLETTIGKVSRAGLIWLLICFSIVLSSRLYTQPLFLGLLPVRATDELLKNVPPQAVVLHPVAVSDYLRYRFAEADGSPRLFLSGSGRQSIYAPKTYAELMRLAMDPAVLGSAIQEFAPAAVLLPEGAPAAALLSSLPGWRQLYAEKGGEDLPKYYRKSVQRWVVFLSTDVADNGSERAVP